MADATQPHEPSVPPTSTPLSSGSDAQSAPVRPVRMWDSRPAATPQEVALDKLMEHVGPLAELYFESQAKIRESDAREHEREMAFEAKLLEHQGRQHRMNVIAASLFGVVMLGFAGFMVYHGRDASAVDLIKTIGSLVAVGFGGYGYAMSRAARAKRDDA